MPNAGLNRWLETFLRKTQMDNKKNGDLYAESPICCTFAVRESTMRRIILITGGQRSGKSTYAEQLALKFSPNPVYVATAHIWDEEFRQRVLIHQERRGPQWTNIEEELHLSHHAVEGRVVLVDCLTLWSTNFFFLDGKEQPVQQTVDAVCAEFDRFVEQDAIFIFVTNEIGLGGTSPNDVQRHFTDVLGWVNQHVAAVADKVVLMVSGIPLTIKTNETI